MKVRVQVPTLEYGAGVFVEGNEAASLPGCDRARGIIRSRSSYQKNIVDYRRWDHGRIIGRDWCLPQYLSSCQVQGAERAV